MKISRRTFLGGGITVSAATLLSLGPTGLTKPSSRSERIIDCALLDLKSHCALRESLQGYQAALADACKPLEAISDSRCRFRLVIVPGIGLIDPVLAETLSDLLKAGTHLLLESGAGFMSPSEFVDHQRMLHHYFGLAVLPPVDLWPGRFAHDDLFAAPHGVSLGEKLDRHESIPYIKYVWPQETRVRDFSRVIPASAEPGDVIGRVGPLPVALKRRMFKGGLIFLGSPLGPALGAGDLEARSWLRLAAALCQGSLPTPAAHQH